MNNTKLRLLGDVHGYYSQYLEIISTAKSSIQLGDFGFSYHFLHNVDSNNHKILLGNHDNYNERPLQHDLGDFGLYNNMFFIRGAYSIDKQYRIPNVSWWPDEELTYTDGKRCIELYAKIKPNFVISHECPEIVAKLLHKDIIKSYTSSLLNVLFHYHQPKYWIFAHHHMSINRMVYDTRFICLNELEYIDIDLENLK